MADDFPAISEVSNGPPFGAPPSKAPPKVLTSFLDMDQTGPQGVSEMMTGGIQQELLTDKQSLCIEILVNGYVNSFVDFFYLTHRSETDAAAREPIPETQLTYIKHQLTIAEKAHRRGDSEKVLAALDSLASYFQDTADYKTAIYFYERCLDIADSMDDGAMQGNAYLNLGLTHDAMGDTAAAIKFHERHLELALGLGHEERLKDAFHQLVQSYRRYAEEYERKGDHADALELYKKCLEAASNSGHLESQGLATYRLGIVSGALGERSSSVQYHQRYHEICQETGDAIGEGQACAALAQSFKAMGDLKLAIKYLEKYLNMATTNKQSVAQAEACAGLGAIYSEQGDHQRAVTYFEKGFEIARSVGDRKLVDSARINLGTARGNMAMGGYMDVVTVDLPALLQWKAQRVTF
jgi:tetratricopeptide (TPR) repeat protein